MVSKSSDCMHAPTGMTLLESAICWTMYSGIITICGRLSWLLWVYLSIVSL